MTVTIEVTNEAGVLSATKRTVLSSEDHGTAGDLEAAAVAFIRTARRANEETLANFAPNSGPVGVH